MKRPTWFKFHALAPADPKVCCLSSDAVRWGWVLCLCSAKMQEKQGRWRNRRHLAAAAHVTDEIVSELIEAELLHETPDGVVVHGWDNWQCDDEASAERSRRYRERVSEREPSANRAHAEREPSAERHGENESESERESERENERTNERAKPDKPLTPAPPNPDSFHATALLVEAGLSRKQADKFTQVYGLPYATIRREVEAYRGKPTGVLVWRLQELATAKGQAATATAPAEEIPEWKLAEIETRKREDERDRRFAEREKAERAKAALAQGSANGSVRPDGGSEPKNVTAGVVGVLAKNGKVS